MLDFLDEVAGPGYSQGIVVTLLALFALILLLLAIRLLRGLFAGTFVAGGRNRKTRLAVMDATALDNERRLVLVRRDDIEHLLLIGGKSDIVVERDIRIGQQRRPAIPTEPAREPQVAQPAAPQPAPPAVPPRRAPEPARAAPPAPISRLPAQPAPRPPEMLPLRPAARPEPARLAPAPQPTVAPRPEPRIPPVAPPAPPPHANSVQAQADDLDDALLKELEVSLDDNDARPGKPQQAPTLDEEMAKLLGELSNPRR
ncbi:hypothetical protein ACSBOB_17915 [Mesorhizobium sp. ASY16-5R]|jgi:hypothetical protein|uniref:hypothetical protein n=1 Tax=Mesorhizobium sp. ASY16-5R TaxID=3445772 RepID=UPI003FA10789